MTDDDVDVLDLTAVAAAHPVRRVKLDVATIEQNGLLSIGDIVDMAERLHVDPLAIAAAMKDSSGSAMKLDFMIALAWVIGRKADPALSYDEVRTSWRVEVPDAPPADPTPPTPQPAELATSSG